MSVKSFEDLLVWKRARAAAAQVYKVTRGPMFRRDWALTDQMRRSAVSMMSNIAEGFERRQPRDFARFLLYSKASCAELRSQVYLAKDIGYMDKEVSDCLLRELEEIGCMIGVFRMKVSGHQ